MPLHQTHRSKCAVPNQFTCFETSRMAAQKNPPVFNNTLSYPQKLAPTAWQLWQWLNVVEKRSCKLIALTLFFIFSPTVASAQLAVWIGRDRSGPGSFPTAQHNSGAWHDHRNWGMVGSNASVPGRGHGVKFNFADIGTSGDLSTPVEATVSIVGTAEANSIDFETRPHTYMTEWGNWTRQRPINVTLDGSFNANLNVNRDIRVHPYKGADAVVKLQDLNISAKSIKIRDVPNSLYIRPAAGVLTLQTSETTTSDGFFVESRDPGGSTLKIFGGSFTTTSPQHFGHVSSGSNFETSRTVLNTKLLNEGTWDIYHNTRLTGILDGLGTINLKESGTEGFLELDSGRQDWVAQKITGAGGLKISSGNVRLSGSNSFNGGLTVGPGARLRIDGGINLGALNNTITLNDAALDLSEAVSNSLTLASSNWRSSGNTVIDLGTRQATVTGDWAGSGQINVQGNGRLILQGNNHNFAGQILVNSGAFIAGAKDSLGLNTRVSVAEGASFQLQDNEEWGSLSGRGYINLGDRSAILHESQSTALFGRMDGTGRFTMAGDGRIRFDNHANLSNFTGTIEATNGTLELDGFSIGRFDGTLASSQSGTIELNTRNSPLTFDGTLTNNGRVLKTGSGTLTIAGSVTGSSGVMEVREGRVIAEGVRGDTLHLSGGKFQSLFNAYVDNVQVDAGTSFLGEGNKDYFIRAQLSGVGTLKKLGTGAIHSYRDADFSGFTGELHVQQGAAVMRTDLANGSLHLGTGTMASIETPNTVHLGSLTGDGVLQLHDPSTGGYARSIRVGGNDQSSSFAGNILGQGVVFKDGQGTLSITGENADSWWVVQQGALEIGKDAFGRGADLSAGTSLQLSDSMETGGKLTAVSGISTIDTGDNDWTFGGTIVGSGSLEKQGIGNFVFNGNAQGLGGKFIAAEGILSGTGTFADLEIEAAIFRPGESPGQVKVDNFTLNTDGILEIELGGLDAGSLYDQLLISGDATLAGELDVKLIDGFVLGADQEFLIAEIDGTLTGEFMNLGEGSLVGTFGDQDLYITYRAGSGNSIGLITAVPEPNSGLLCFLAVLLMNLRRGRKVNS